VKTLAWISEKFAPNPLVGGGAGGGVVGGVVGGGEPPAFKAAIALS